MATNLPLGTLYIESERIHIANQAIEIYPQPFSVSLLGPHRQLLLDSHSKHVGYTPPLCCIMEPCSFAAMENKGAKARLLQCQ